MADGLISWRDWSKGALEEARQAEKPILLVIEQFWCPLSRLLHFVGWNDPGVAAGIEEGFIPVRVDGARRPDVGRRYRTGASPTIAFLTPDARLIAASGFLPPDVLENAMESVQTMLRDRPDEVMLRVENAEAEREALRQLRADPHRTPSPWMTGRIIESLQTTVDPEWGGWGEAAKVPHLDAVAFLLSIHLRVKDDAVLAPAVLTLDGMLHGGLYDWDDGGFYRSSDSADWSHPVRAKLLSDQARHISTFLLAYRATGTEDYAECITGVSQFCADALYDPITGLFGASVAPPAPEDLAGEISGAAWGPLVDRTPFTDANAQMARALMSAGETLGDKDLIDVGLKCVASLEEKLWPTEGFAFHYLEGTPMVRGLLGDQAELGLALLAAARAVGDSGYADRAESLAWHIHDWLFDPRQDGYFDAEDPMEIGLISARDKAFEENMILARFFARLGRVRGSAWTERAERVLGGFTGVWEQLGPAVGSFGLGLLEVFAEKEEE